METNKVSKKLLNRLPVYLNFLKSLPEDIENISATIIAKELDMGAVQVRKDLAKVSHSGRRRTGRSREQLIEDIEHYLEFVTETGAILVGAGKLGQALLEFSRFEDSGINLMAGFDICPVEDNPASCKPIYPLSRLESFCKYFDVTIGILAVPAQNAQEICDCMIACGIKAIWNFAPVRLKTPEYVVVQNEDLAASLASLRIQLKNQTKLE